MGQYDRFCSLQGRKTVPLVAPRLCNCYWRIMSIMMCLNLLWLCSSTLPTLSALLSDIHNLMFCLVRHVVAMRVAECRLVTSSINRIPWTNTGVILSVYREMPAVCVSLTIRGPLTICPAPRGCSKGIVRRLFDLLWLCIGLSAGSVKDTLAVRWWVFVTIFSLSVPYLTPCRALLS